VANAIKLVQKGNVDAVKMEGGSEIADIVRKLTSIGIPVMGHVGLLPQRHVALSGYKVQGRTAEDAKRVVQNALALEEAGAFSIVVEAVPKELGAFVTQQLRIPTIGIGAGPDCDGQVLVFHDIVNLTFAEPAKFVRRYGDAAAVITNAVQQFKHDVETGGYPSDAESYHLPKGTKMELEAILRRKEMKAYAR